LAIKLASALAWSGCAAPAAVAPFPARPDTVLAGDLAGPFDGRVVDADSGKPVEGASVLASWAFEAGDGLHGPAAASSALEETDADGRYRVARLSDAGGAGARLARFTLVVYKRQYLAYRSDRRFDDLEPRRDFAQTGNLVKLERMAADVSHARHLRFVGAGGPLLPRLAWELQRAAEERATPTAKPVASANLDATVLLSADELKAVTGYGGTFVVEKLADLPSTPHYDSVHFRAEGQAETFDAALRVFKIDGAAAEQQYEVMAKELPGAEEKNELGDRSLRAREGDIYAVGTLDRAHGVVLLFTCGAKQCADFDMVVALARRMATRFGKLEAQPVPLEPKLAPPSAPSELKPLEPAR
jgi:hypothetical protein